MNKEPKSDEPSDNFSALVKSDAFIQAVATALPAHLTPERFIRIALTARIRTPKLKECDRDSLLQCLMQLSQFGLEPDGRHAHLIPFWNSKRNVMECVLIIDYKGLAALVMRSGAVSYVHADKVCEFDKFTYDKGQVTQHVIDFTHDRGKPYAYYAMVRFKDGTEKADAMTLDEVKAIQKRSRAGSSGPWITDFDEMGKKTVFRRLSKWLPLSAEYRDAVDMDADALEELRFENAKPLEIKRAKIPEQQKEGDAICSAKVEKTSTTETETLNPSIPNTLISEAARTVQPAGAAAAQEWDEFAKRSYGASATYPPDNPPPEKKTEPLKRKKKATRSVIETQGSPFQAEMLNRLSMGHKTPEQLLKVAVANDWCSEDETWPLDESKLAKFLDPENFDVIMQELDALPR